VVDFVTWVGSASFVEDLRVDVEGSVPRNSSVVDTGWMGWVLSEDVVIGLVVDVFVVVAVVVGLVLTTTVDGFVGSCIGVVRTISWYSTSSGYCLALVVLTMSWYSTLSWNCCAFVVRTMSWYSSLPLSILSVVVVPRVLLEVGILLVLLTRACPPIPDLAAKEGCWEAAGCVEFTLELTGRRIFRLRIRSRFDGLCGASSSCRGDLVVD